VLGGMTVRFEKTREHGRQLMVNEKIHAPCSTT
jgi:hypothetical protein